MKANEMCAASNQGPSATCKTKKKYGTVLDGIFEEFDVNIDVDFEIDEALQGNVPILMTMCYLTCMK